MASESVRTAIVIVHGMGEQLPLETLNRFVKTALPSYQGQRHYFSRPARITDSYEARRLLAYRQPYDKETVEPLVHGHVEFFEYHWSYKMTDNRFSDLIRTTARLLLRSPASVPNGLRVVWLLVWALLLLLIGSMTATVTAGITLEEFTLQGVVTALLGEGLVAALVLKGLNWLGGAVAKSFVDVVRYLDRSPRSYAARRDIRKGMVDLLQSLHDRGIYSRVVVVAHSLGAYIAYDGITWLWPELCKLHHGPVLAQDIGMGCLKTSE